ncbi:MAG TPA: hypothetical protein VMT85_12290 [Thermoanaerobaculia bacterium]|nr:hypothetical protein [Thermoanaerobaculia bacterium]
MPPTNGCRRRAASALVADASGLDVIPPIGYDERQRREARDDRLVLARTAEALQQLLQQQARREDRLGRDRADWSLSTS